MKLAIVGSRSFTDWEELFITIHELVRIVEIELIVSGGAKGADKLAERFADFFDIPKKVIKPEWKLYGRKAGFLRNQDIVDAADKVIAFWDGKSKGTKSTIDIAKSQDKLLKIINFGEEI